MLRRSERRYIVFQKNNTVHYIVITLLENFLCQTPDAEPELGCTVVAEAEPDSHCPIEPFQR